MRELEAGKTVLLPLVGTSGRILRPNAAGQRYEMRGRRTQRSAGARVAEHSSSSWFWAWLRPPTRGRQLVSDLVSRKKTHVRGAARKHFVSASLAQELNETSR